MPALHPYRTGRTEFRVILDHDDAYRLLRHHDIRCTDKKPHSKTTYLLRTGSTPHHDRAVSLTFGDATAERESPLPQEQAEAMMRELHQHHREGIHSTKGERMLAHVLVKSSKAFEKERGITSIALAIEVQEEHYEVFEATIEVSRHIKLPPAPLPNKGHEGQGFRPAGRQER